LRALAGCALFDSPDGIAVHIEQGCGLRPKNHAPFPTAWCYAVPDGESGCSSGYWDRLAAKDSDSPPVILA